MVSRENRQTGARCRLLSFLLEKKKPGKYEKEKTFGKDIALMCWMVKKKRKSFVLRQEVGK